MRADIIIQARMRSTRLPGKVLKPLLGEPILLRIVQRAKQSQLVDRIIVATSDLEIDDEIFVYCVQNGIECFRGSESDVLDRYYQCALRYNSKTIVRLTADNVLFDPETIDRAIDYFEKNKLDYLYYHIGLPLGSGVEVFSMRSLKKAWSESADLRCREHVTYYMYSSGELFKWEKAHIANVADYSKLRFTVDTKEDYAFVKRVFEALYSWRSDFNQQDIIELLEQHHDWMDINKDISQKGE